MCSRGFGSATAVLLSASLSFTGCGSAGPSARAEAVAAVDAAPAIAAPTPLDAALQRLHTYRELRRSLELLEVLSFGRVQTGALIRNGRNRGLVDIDGRVADVVPGAAGVCGPGASPSIRQAVTCTIEPGGPGNTEPSRIGYSTQGRELLAARIGNRRGLRVAVFTQLHGNEVASTEAALATLWELAFSDAPWARQARQHLDLLFLLRANPDGGEPRTDCAIGPFDVGATFPQDCALTRWNVDKQAGVPRGGPSTEERFFGVVGQGYDLNRYHFPLLDGAIRPVESQAMVAALLAFRPSYLVDLHGDVVKTVCSIVPQSIVVDPTTSLPLALQCEADPSEPLLGPSPVDELISFSTSARGYADPADPRRLRTRALMAGAAQDVEALGLGPPARLTQIALGSGILGGDTDAYGDVGVAPMTLEVRNFSPTAIALAVTRIDDGQPSVGFVTDWPFDPAFLPSGIAIHRAALKSIIRSMTALTGGDPTSDGSYCGLPTASGAVFTMPERFFGPNPLNDSPAVLPFALVPVQTTDDCPAPAP